MLYPEIAAFVNGYFPETVLQLSTMNTLTENAPCPYNGRCGGCPMQGVAYEKQLLNKKEFLWKAFSRAGISAIPDIKVVPSSPFEYRNRVQFHRVPRCAETGLPGGKPRMRPLKLEREAEALCGFMTRSGNKSAAEIVPVNDCLIADPSIRQALKTSSITIPIDRDRFSVYGRDSTLLVEGRASSGVTRIHQKDIRIDAGTFFQSNGALLELLIDELLSIAGTADRRLPAADLYCGVGTFAVYLQDIFERIDLLEANKAALNLARVNVPLAKARFSGQRDTVWAMNAGKAAREPYGFAVVDPSRQGLSGAMCRFLRDNCEILCYVSCNPLTLARDVVTLLDPEAPDGLRLESLTFYDFYPQTHHIESLAVFTRKKKCSPQSRPPMRK
ncbi:MAG: class I SAM-dependent RNA methyltransferase [Spirochaetaceae bacterium]|jgi:23S rRNA (uracil1939-C5)-methyltransferase|nr:class I SAM-dependent RNA methyltransferase [Spirochaetaceae bacterium]